MKFTIIHDGVGAGYISENYTIYGYRRGGTVAEVQRVLAEDYPGAKVVPVTAQALAAWRKKVR